MNAAPNAAKGIATNTSRLSFPLRSMGATGGKPRSQLSTAVPSRASVSARHVGGTRERGGRGRAQSASDPMTVEVDTVEFTVKMSPVRFHELGATITSC